MATKHEFETAVRDAAKMANALRHLYDMCGEIPEVAAAYEALAPEIEMYKGNQEFVAEGA